MQSRMAGTRMMQTGMNRAMMTPRNMRPINGMSPMPRSMMSQQRMQPRRAPMMGTGRMAPVRQPSARMNNVRQQRGRMDPMDPMMGMDPRNMMMGRR